MDVDLDKLIGEVMEVVQGA
jgi:hypothetical protein